MNRYFSSFLVTSLIYAMLLSLVFANFNTNIVKKKKTVRVHIHRIIVQKILHKPKKIKVVKRIAKKPKLKPKKRVKPKTKPKTKPKKRVKKVIHKSKQIKLKPPLSKPKKVLHKTIVQKIFKPIPRKTDENLTKPTPKSPPKIDLKARYLKYNYQKILSSIKDVKFYPRRARKLHIEGEVKVRFLLKKDGNIDIKEVVCVKRFLKKATRKTIKKASAYFPKPPKDLYIKVTLVYKLRD